jgi:hypothetical protein
MRRRITSNPRMPICDNDKEIRLTVGFKPSRYSVRNSINKLSTNLDNNNIKNINNNNNNSNQNLSLSKCNFTSISKDDNFNFTVSEKIDKETSSSLYTN